MIPTSMQKIARALSSNSTRSGYPVSFLGKKGTDPEKRSIGAESPGTCFGKYTPFSELYKPPKDSPAKFACMVPSVGTPRWHPATVYDLQQNGISVKILSDKIENSPAKCIF